MTFESMDKTTAGRISEIAEKALAEAMAGYGVEVTRSSGTFDPAKGSLGVRFTFTVSGSDAAHVVDFGRYNYRFPKWHIGDEFHIAQKGRESLYRLAGYRPRASKRPFLIERVSDGKLGVMAFEALALKLGAKS